MIIHLEVNMQTELINNLMKRVALLEEKVEVLLGDNEIVNEKPDVADDNIKQEYITKRRTY